VVHVLGHRAAFRRLVCDEGARNALHQAGGFQGSDLGAHLVPLRFFKAEDLGEFLHVRRPHILKIIDDLCLRLVGLGHWEHLQQPGEVVPF
jgi:hypothetical protein